MKKFKLDLQKLSVESFETSILKTEKGTVKGNNPEITLEETCEDPQCTFYHSCNGATACGCTVTQGYTCALTMCAVTCNDCPPSRIDDCPPIED